MALRVTRQYVDVLISVPLPAQVHETCSDDLALIDEAQAGIVRGADSDLGLTQSTVIQLDLVRGVESELAFEQTIEIHSPLWRTVEHSLGLTSNVVARYPHRVSHSDTVAFEQGFGGQKVAVRQVSDGIELTGTVARVVHAVVADVMALSDEGLKRDAADSVLEFVQTIECGRGGDAADTLGLTHAIGLELAIQRGIADVCGLKQAVTYIVVGRRYDRQYCPFVGDGVPGAPTPPPTTLTSPLNDITAPLQFVFPSAGAVTDSVTLRAPEFGNKDRLTFNRVLRETRGGSLIVFADPMWPKVQTLVLTVTALRGPEKDDLLAFIDDYVGQEVGLIDWEKRYWRGLISPEVTVVEDSWNSYTVNLEFEGELDPTWAPQIIPVLPGTPRRRVSPSHGAVPNPLEPIPPVEPTSEVYTAETDSSVIAGQPLYIKGTGHAALAAANSTALANVVGFATTAAEPTFSVSYITEGKLTLTDWTAIAGAATLTPGSAYYLSVATGRITSTPPSESGEYVVRVGRATSTLTLDIEIEPSVRL